MLEDENIINHENEGRNKIFFLKDSIIAKQNILRAEHYKTIRFLENNPKMEILFSQILEKTKGMVFLFGSYAKGEQTKDSDIDIYVDSEEQSIKKELELLNSRLSVKLGKFRKSSGLIREIVKNHIILRGADELYEKLQEDKVD